MSGRCCGAAKFTYYAQGVTVSAEWKTSDETELFLFFIVTFFVSESKQPLSQHQLPLHSLNGSKKNTVSR